jgi:hypothetical protein
MDQPLLNQLPLDVLLASLCYLMSRHALTGDQALAQAGSRHLAMLSRHPDCESAVLSDAGRRLLGSGRCGPAAGVSVTSAVTETSANYLTEEE